jgi:hypothetical protein
MPMDPSTAHLARASAILWAISRGDHGSSPDFSADHRSITPVASPSDSPNLMHSHAARRALSCPFWPLIDSGHFSRYFQHRSTLLVTGAAATLGAASGNSCRYRAITFACPCAISIPPSGLSRPVMVKYRSVS